VVNGSSHAAAALAERRQWSAARPAGHEHTPRSGKFSDHRTRMKFGASRFVSWPARRAALRGAALRSLALASACVCLARVDAKEIHSNGLGGGRWSDAATWRGGAIPTAEDDAVVAARDTVLFDRDDADKPTCKQLILDPNSNFAFQSGLGRRTLTVNGPIEAYGSLKMHAPGASDEMEIRLVSEIDAERVIKLQHGGALLVLGRADMPDGKRTAAISTPKVVPPKKTEAPVEIRGIARTVVDLQNARLDNVVVLASGIDNTGAKPNERCNLVGNRFTSFGRVAVQSCDTPAIVRNDFEGPAAGIVRPAAIEVGYSPLADIRGNRVVGPFAVGISIGYCECSVIGNSVANCPTGILWHGGSAMLKQNTIRACGVGLNLRTTSGSVEDTEIDKANTPITVAATKAQLTSVMVTNPATNQLLDLQGSSVGLLNCNIRPDQVRIDPAAKSGAKKVRGEEPLETLMFLVVAVKGKIPPRAQVELVTANPEKPLAPGASDLNVRNSPAAVRPDGFTPLPASLTPLIVKSWRMEEDGEVVPAPEYTLTVWEPPTEPGGKPRVLKTLKLKPDDKWYRSKPNDLISTLEVKLP